MRTLYLGDIHCNFNIVKHYINLFNIKDAAIIQVGDFGVGFMRFEHELEQLKRLNEVLIENNVTLYAIRGNHDYKPYFDNDPFMLSNIKLIKDYTVLNINDENILCIGGAVSIDRELTKTDRQRLGDNTPNIGLDRWWADEILTFDREFLENVRDIDVIVTHTTTDFCTPNSPIEDNNFLKPYLEGDKYLAKDITTERTLMTEIFNIVKKNNNIKEHYYGHFHRDNLDIIDGIEHRLLGENKLYEKY